MEKAVSLAGRFKSVKEDIHIAGRNTSEALDFVKQSEIIVNTTSLGLHKRDPLPLKKSWLRKSHLVMDMIYNPRETRFLKAAKECGCRIANGLDMLVYQGAESFRIWTGKKPDPAVMKKAAMKVIY